MLEAYGEFMKTITLATFNDVDHAQPLVNRLQQAGFHPTMLDESRWQERHFAEHLASVKVQVDESESAAADRQLHQWDVSEHCLDQAVTCPECHSPEVDFPQVTRKFVMPALHSILYKLGVLEKQFYCQKCQHTWPTRSKLEPARDALNWPVKNTPLHENKDVTP